uniref:Uncharacterized protein n=1 Tax=Solibacter usitatus (strain Ellin6076) TaxID=234267 RepID=Q021H0_SOLUE
MLVILKKLATLLGGALLFTTAAFAQTQTDKGGGNVQPPHAKPQGYSLEKMAELLAQFGTSGNNPQYYPKTPFQVLYGDPSVTTVTGKVCPDPPGGTGILVSGGKTFVVKPGTEFFVPIAGFDDSPPVVGTFPSQSKDAADYVFGTNDYWARGYTIIVDGDTTAVGPEFLAGPVVTPPLSDGGGTHIIQLGVFLTPMTAGTHLVTIQGEIASNSVLLATGLSCIDEKFTYTVQVVPSH